MRLRQVALAATELAPSRARLFELLGITADYQDPGVGEFGLENSVMAIGDTFLEVVAPIQADTAAGRTLQRMGADVCGYMALFQVDNFATCAAHLQAQQLRQVWSVERPEVSACHVHPKDIGGAIVSFDEMRPAEDWLWAGPNWRRQQASNVSAIVGCEVGSPEPAALAQRWSLALNLPGTRDKNNNPCIELQAGHVSFVHNPAREAIQTIIFATDQPRALQDKAEQMGIHQGDTVRLGQCSLVFIDQASLRQSNN